MPAEVERVQGEISPKVGSDNGSEDRQDMVGSNANQDLTDEINRVGNGDGNDKEESNGSYVFAADNNAVGADPVKSDPYHCKVDGNVERDRKGAEEEGGNGNSGEQKMADIKIDGDPARVDEKSQTMVEAEPERPDDVEKEGPLPGVGSAEKVEESKDSGVGPGGLPDNEGQINTDKDIDVERVQAEKIERQDKSDLDIHAGHKTETVASEDVQHSEDVNVHPVDSDGRGESEWVSVEIPSADPIDEVTLGQSAHTYSGPTVDLPESDGNDGMRPESVAVIEAVSVEKSEGVETGGVNVASDEDDYVRLDSEMEKVHASDDKVAIGSESGALKDSDSDENGNVLSESGAVEVTSLNPNGVVHSYSQIVTSPGLGEGANPHSKSQALEVSHSDENVHVESDSENIEAPAVNLEVNIQPETKIATTSNLDEDANTQLVPQDVKVSDSTEIGCVQSDSEVVKAHNSFENNELQTETRAVDVSVSDGNGNIHLESQHISEIAPDQDRQFQVASVATGAPTFYQDTGSQLESEAVDVATSGERSDVASPIEENVPRTAIADTSFSKQQEPEQNGNSELDEGLSSPAPLEAGPTENNTRLDLSSDISTQGPSEDPGPGMNQKILSDTQSGQELAGLKEKCTQTGQDQENAIEVSGAADVCQTVDVEPQSSTTGDLSEKASNEKTEILHVNLNGSLSGADSKTTVYELIENSSDGSAEGNGAVGSESEVVQPGKTWGEPTVSSPTADNMKIETEAEKSSMVDVTEAIPKDVHKEVTTEEVHETGISNVEDCSAIDAAEEVESGTKSFQNTNPTVNIDKVEAVIDNDPEENEKESSYTTTNVASETKISGRDLKSEVAISSDDTPTEAEDVVSEAVAESMGSQPAGDEEGTNATENERMLSTCPTVDEKAEVEAHSQLQCTAESAVATDAKVVSTCDDIEIQKDQTSTSSRQDSAVDASEGHNVAAEMERKPFYFLPRVPRYDDEKLAEEIKRTEAEVDQKTRSRDAIRAEIQKIKAGCKESDSNFRAAIVEEKSSREALHSKRKEIESLQSVINRAKSATSVDDIDTRVHRMEHMMQHETLPLKEEKQFIREIKQLKQLRDQISSNMGSQDEVQRALDEREKTEERLKVLRKELDMLRNNLSKAETVTKAARERYDYQSDELKKLLDQFKAADAVRQEAYAHLQSLRKQLREKNKHFFKCRGDSKTAIEMALRKEREALQNFCLDRVETFMNLWNNDRDFRTDYIRCNTRSTLRRLGTLDGRSLGPDEEPIQITYPRSERADKLRTSNERSEKHEMVPPASAQQEKAIHFEDAKVEDAKPIATTAESNNQNNKSKKPIKSAPPPSSLASILIEEAATTEEEQPNLTKEEEELMRKAEEKRKQEEAAKLKEQRRMEEITKAKEAMERKKKKEEKMKARAAMRAQKEAEEKAKEREKKLRKKERKKATDSEETPIANSETEPPTSQDQTETPEETEQAEKQQHMQSQPKKPNKPSQFHKLNKSKSIPPPLRNRSSKRRLQQWMWVAIAALLLFALFLLGNTNLSLSPSNLWFLI